MGRLERGGEFLHGARGVFAGNAGRFHEFGVTAEDVMEVDAGVAADGVVGDHPIEALLPGQKKLADADVDAHEEASEVGPGHVDLGIRRHLAETDHIERKRHQPVCVHGPRMGRAR